MIGARWLVGLVGSLPWLLLIAGVDHPAAFGLFAPTCHQLPDRSLFLAGSQMVVCSRCAGLYVGLVVGTLRPWPTAWLDHGRTALLAAVALMLTDVLTQDLGLHPPWHPTRLATGAAFGVVLSGWLFGLLSEEAAGSPAE